MRPILISVLLGSALLGCDPNPAKQALLEQLVSTRSAIAAGVTPTTLRDREIALRTAVELARTHLSKEQITKADNAIFGISKTREGWSIIYEFCDGTSGMVIINDQFCANELGPIFESLGAADTFTRLYQEGGPLLDEVVGPLLNIDAARVDTAIDSLR